MHASKQRSGRSHQRTSCPPAYAEPLSDRPSRVRNSGLPRHADTGARPRPRALIVDDEEDTRELYAWCLRAAGWVVDGVGNGEEAIRSAAEFEPDVIVMDLRLPGLGGLEAARRLKTNEETAHIPIVMCSGADRVEAEAGARQAGCDAFVGKPCLPDDLRVLLESLVAATSGSHG